MVAVIQDIVIPVVDFVARKGKTVASVLFYFSLQMNMAMLMLLIFAAARRIVTLMQDYSGLSL